MNRISKQKQQGAGIIEVLVSLLVLAIGLLGVLSLQTNGLNSNQRAAFVTEAQLLAEDMASRILAFGSTDFNGNLGPSASAASDGVVYSYNNIIVNKLPMVPTYPNCNAGCDAAATITFDTNEWQSALSRSSLPRGRATVTFLDPVYTIRVMWDQDREGGAGLVTCNPDNCFTMEISLQ